MSHQNLPLETLTPRTAYVTPPNSELLDVPPGLPTPHLGVDYYMIVWNGHEFEAVYADSWARAYVGDPPYWVRPRVRKADNSVYEPSMLMYYPIDQRMTLADVVGATVAYPNEENTGWLFAHCDNDAMVDYEKELAAAVVGEFAGAIDGAQIKVNEATNAPVKAQAVANHAALVAFRDASVESVVTWARTRHIGWQEQNPHEAHVHTPALQAIESVALSWQTDRSADYSKVSSPVASIIKGLAKPHTYETRWDKEARLAAEAKAREAEAETETEGT